MIIIIQINYTPIIRLINHIIIKYVLIIKLIIKYLIELLFKLMINY